MTVDKLFPIHNDTLAQAICQQVLQMAGYVIASFDHDGKLTFITDTVQMLTGYTPDEVLGLTFDDLFHQFSSETHINPPPSFHQDFVMTQETTHPIITKDGNTKWVEHLIISNTDDGFYTLVKDVTEKYLAKQMLAEQIAEGARQYAEIQALFERVNKLEKLKSDMIRVAAHDLRAPLSVFVTHLDVLSIELAEMPNLAEKLHLEEHLDDMRNATKRMRRIIEDILSLERIEQHAQHAEYTPLDLMPLVQGIFYDYQPHAEKSAIEFVFTCQNHPHFIQGDIAQLREAVVNLISNAIKYTPEGGKSFGYPQAKRRMCPF